MLRERRCASDDEVKETGQRELYQSVAPKGTVEAGLYLVPKVIE